MRGITVKLFIKEGEETVYTAYIEAVYNKDPAAENIIPQELTMGSLRQAFADIYYPGEDSPHTLFGTADAFSVDYNNLKSGVSATLRFIEFNEDDDLQRYSALMEDSVTLEFSMTFGRILAECSSWSELSQAGAEEIKSFIEEIVKAAGG